MNDRSVAYFSMEIALEGSLPTYSGGLGVLAGDTIRSAADLGIPMLAVTLIHRKGYFHQRLLPDGWQEEAPADWSVRDFLEELPSRTSVTIEGRRVFIRAWRYEVSGITGYKIPVFFLDTDLPENAEWDRTLTHYLYGGDQYYRLCQEIILGIGGVRMIRALNYHGIERFHMNEGHASLLTLELLDEEAKKAGRGYISRVDIQAVRGKCVFTTHTPVPAGHDQFPLDMVSKVFQREDFLEIKDVFCPNLARHVLAEGKAVSEMGHVYTLNMTYLALNLSHYVNGVAKRHGEISEMMFSGFTIDSITNGVHAATWASSSFQKLYDSYIPGWKEDNFSLRYAIGIPRTDILQAHMQAKHDLMRYVTDQTKTNMEAGIFTIGFARRATLYKRLDLFFTDLDRLRSIASKAGQFQVVCAGKAHPKDQGGKEVVKKIFRAGELLKKEIRIVYLENYNMSLAKLMIAGVDLWLNTPQPPLEASGTSGMKAALNGVPTLSVLDGWWIEGHIENVTGWSIGERDRQFREERDGSRDAVALYDKLEDVIVPMYYNRRDEYANVMRHAIAVNGSFFNTQRMLNQYVSNAYFR